MRKTGRNLICLNCKKEFYAADWDIKGGRGYCSVKCAHDCKYYRNKMVVAKTGKKRPPFSKEWIENIVKSRKASGKGKWSAGQRKKMMTILMGRKLSDKTKKKISDARKGKSTPWQLGEKHHNWKGGRSEISQRIKNLANYTIWREAIFKRDDFICQCCDERGGKLAAHHIILRNEIFDRFNIKTIEDAIICKELWDTENGIVVCDECHKWIHSRNNKEKYFIQSISKRKNLFRGVQGLEKQ